MSETTLTPRAEAVFEHDRWRRLHDLEAWIATAPLEARLGLARFLGDMLDRPPMTERGFREIAVPLGILRYELTMRTPDPLSPEIEGLGVLEQPHPLLDVPLDDQPPVDGALYAVLGGPFAR